jgi:hypothetical protein
MASATPPTSSSASTLVNESQISARLYAQIQRTVTAAISAALPSAVQSAIANSLPPAIHSAIANYLLLSVTSAALVEPEDAQTLVLREIQEDGFCALQQTATSQRFLPLPASLDGIATDNGRTRRIRELTCSFKKLLQADVESAEVLGKTNLPRTARALALGTERRSLRIASGVAESPGSRFSIYSKHVSQLKWPFKDEAGYESDAVVAQRVVAALVARLFPEKVSISLMNHSKVRPNSTCCKLHNIYLE